ncbi:antibiotic biosynthesis monooxygenase family protein [Ancylomarina longa]|nr:antibiotic biosynthesis monooxygenase [Ancylomarina longa]
MIAKTMKTPYYAVIFTSVRTEGDQGYEETADRMIELAKEQQGFSGVESARSELGITVSYWESLEAINSWKHNTEHQMAQKSGKSKWYSKYAVRICKVETDYFFEK